MYTLLFKKSCRLLERRRATMYKVVFFSFLFWWGKMIISVLDPDAEITACDIETREKTMVQAI